MSRADCRGQLVTRGEEQYVRIVDGDALDVVGIEVVAPWHDLSRVVPEAWTRLRARRAELAHAADDVLVEVSVEEPGGLYRELVGVPVTQLGAVPEGMTAVHVPAQRYVHRRHDGPVEQIAASFGAIYEWAAAEGVEVDGFKLDFGYVRTGADHPHDLFVRVVG